MTSEFQRHREVMTYLPIERRVIYEKFLSQTASPDEYDVPLENAWFGGFYDEMIAFLRSLFESALKSIFLWNLLL